MKNPDLVRFVEESKPLVEKGLRQILPSARLRPARLHESMRYSLLSGGKRLRPLLCLAAARACGGSIADALPLACAVECVHAFSLIHDDLPAMDDDDLRRGQPTNHKVYGEAMAILAGDALLSLAFESAARSRAVSRYGHGEMVRELALASGSRQLIGGQAADIEGEGKSLSGADLRFIHERKTSALLGCAVRLGGMSADCAPGQLEALTRFGNRVGLAFQVIDDILDVTQSTETLGKTAGKDQASGKSTYPAVYGLEGSRRIARRLTRQARSSLEGFPARRAAALRALAGHLLERDR